MAGVNRGANDPQGSDHHIQVRIKPDGQDYQAVDNLLFERYDYLRQQVSIPASQLPGTFRYGIRISPDVSPLNTSSDYSAVAYYLLRYPHTLNLEGSQILDCRIPESSITRHLSISNFSTSNTTFLYDLGANKRYEVDHNAITGALKVNVDAGSERYLYGCTEAAVNDISSTELIPVNGTGSFTDPTSWFADSAYVIVSNELLWTQAQAYRNHRQAAYNVALLDITWLYDQFGYGTLRHPKAIRGFVDYARNEWATPPQQSLSDR